MISVCMATYNGKRYLTEQIESVLNNLGPNDELLISDDGSTDGTLDLLDEYASRDCRVKVLHSGHRGVIENFENAIRGASGELFFLCDQDDIWKDGKIDSVRKVFESNPNTMVVVHDAQLVDGNGSEIDQTLFDLRRSKPGFMKNLIKNSYVGCCMAFRRSLLSKALPIPSDVEMHDWWLGLCGELSGETVFLSNRLIDYRRHESNTSSLHHHSYPVMIKNRVVLLAELVRRFAFGR